MRQLTAEEIDHAPEWATHYLINGTDKVTFESVDYYQFHCNGMLYHSRHPQFRGGIMSVYSIPIPEKEKPTSEADLIHEEKPSLQGWVNNG